MRCTLDDLLQRMSQVYEKVNAITVATGQAWDEVLPRLQAGTTELNRLSELARSLGETHTPELEQARVELDRLSSSLATDPLAVDTRALDGVQRTLAATAADLDRLALLRQQGRAEVDRARSTLVELTAAVAEAQTAYEETSARISRPRVAPPPSLDPAIADGPQRLDALLDGGEVAGLPRGRRPLDHGGRTAARVGCTAAPKRAGRPLDARNELRGRLERLPGQGQRVRATGGQRPAALSTSRPTPCSTPPRPTWPPP